MPGAKLMTERVQLAATRMASHGWETPMEHATLLDAVLDQMAAGVIITDAAGRVTRSRRGAATALIPLRESDLPHAETRRRGERKERFSPRLRASA